MLPGIVVDSADTITLSLFNFVFYIGKSIQQFRSDTIEIQVTTTLIAALNLWVYIRSVGSESQAGFKAPIR